jgi:hypothetical protein
MEIRRVHAARLHSNESIWVVSTYLRLKARGLNVKIVDRLVPDAINVCTAAAPGPTADIEHVRGWLSAAVRTLVSRSIHVTSVSRPRSESGRTARCADAPVVRNLKSRHDLWPSRPPLDIHEMIATPCVSGSSESAWR